MPIVLGLLIGSIFGPCWGVAVFILVAACQTATAMKNGAKLAEDEAELLRKYGPPG